MGPWPGNGCIETLREMWIPDSSSPSIEEQQERQTFSSTPTRVSTCPFLTTVGMSMSWLLRRVARMRFWKKREKRPDEETKQGVCICRNTGRSGVTKRKEQSCPKTKIH